MRTIIISGGNIEDDFALDFLNKTDCDFLIGVDRGLEFLKRAGLKPDLILGDFDSADHGTKEYFDQFQITTRVFNPIKDSTDMEIAMGEAIVRGSSEIWVIGATGTRLDHVLGSMKNLSMALEAGIPCFLIDPYNRIRMIDSDTSLKKEEQYGKYVSLLACGGPVTGLTLKGFFYELEDYELGAYSALGVSNEIVKETAQIRLRKGRLLLIESGDHRHFG